MAYWTTAFAPHQPWPKTKFVKPSFPEHLCTRLTRGLAINQFFNSWYTAIQYAFDLVATSVDEIVQLINPPEDTTAALQDIILALTSITAFVAPTEELTGALTGLEASISAVSTAGQILQTAIYGDPSIKNSLFPTGDDTSSLIQIAELKDSLVQVINTVNGNLQSTVELVMSNYSVFLAFANQAMFSEQAPSLQSQNEFLFYAFNEYVISSSSSFRQ